MDVLIWCFVLSKVFSVQHPGRVLVRTTLNLDRCAWILIIIGLVISPWFGACLLSILALLLTLTVTTRLRSSATVSADNDCDNYRN